MLENFLGTADLQLFMLFGQVSVGTYHLAAWPHCFTCLSHWLPLPGRKNDKVEAHSPGVLWKPSWDWSDQGTSSGA